MKPATTHIIRATIPCGPADQGGEVELDIIYRFDPGSPPTNHPQYGPEMGDPAEVEFVSAKAVIGPPPHGAFADLEQQALNDLATFWLDDKGHDQAIDHARDDRHAKDVFHNQLRILTGIDRHELEEVGTIVRNPRAWENFRQDPFRWFIRASDEDADKVWTIIQRRQTR